MSKFFCALALTAVFCLAAGHPIDDTVTGETDVVAKQYRELVESYAHFTGKNVVGDYEADKVKFYLYTEQQPMKYEIKHEDFSHSLKNSTFNPRLPTKIFIHDHRFPEHYYKELVTAYLRHYPKSVNVITVDHWYCSGTDPKDFERVYREISATVTKFFEVLVHDQGMTGDRIHFIGHGVGAHIAAAVAQTVSSVKVDRITGLDPYGLVFDHNQNLPQLQKHSANFVDVIVTNANGVGTKEKSRGHVNFFPNGGESQPQGDMMISHLKSYFYFVESIVRGKVFESCAVEGGYENFKTGSCGHAETINYMGEYVLRNKVGAFYLRTNPVPPYSQSNDSTFKVEEIKLSESYLCVVLGTTLEPFSFISKDDPDYKNAVACSNRMFKGFTGEFSRHARTHVHQEMGHQYSINDLKHE